MAISAGEIVGHLFIPGRMWGLNELVDARIRTGGPVRGKKMWNRYSHAKRGFAQFLMAELVGQRFPKLTYGYFTYVFDEPNRKRDPSNILGGGIKFIEDALIKAGYLPNDGWGNIQGIRGFWRQVPKRPGAHLIVTKDDCLTFEEAVYEADKPLGNPTPLDFDYEEFG